MMLMEEKARIVEEIKTLMKDAEQYKSEEFRIKLEQLVNSGEEEGEYELVQFMNDKHLKPETRMEILRVAGSLQHSSFLVPLKKVIESEPNHRIQQEAIIAVARFNDRRALNILSQAQQKIIDPILKRTLNEEIARIKENNPILGLLPRFQAGEKSPKTFRVTLDVLKRILTPADATIFTKFLGSSDPLIQQGAYEILCMTGDIFHDSEILEFFETKLKNIKCLEEKECEDLYLLVYHLKFYLSRYQFILEEQIENLTELYPRFKDKRVKHLLLNMICQSKEEEAMTFIAKTYSEEKDSRSVIVESLSGNENAADFLFQQYNNDPSLRNIIIESLLNTQKGLDYFVKHFFTLSFEDQEIIAQKLPYAGQHNLVDFIQQIFRADTYRLKEILLTKVKENYEFSIKELLFDPTRQREFQFMGDDYLDTIIQLFPVTSVKRLLETVATKDLSVNKCRKILERITELVQQDLIINLRDKEFITTLFTKIINANNTELNILFLGILKHIRTIDAITLRNIRDSLGLFISRRETKLSPKEQGELTRIKRRLKDLFFEIKKIEEGKNTIKRLINTKEIDLDAVTYAIQYHHLSVVQMKDQLIQYLCDQFQSSSRTDIDAWTNFFHRFPRLAGLMKPVIEQKSQDTSDSLFRALLDISDSLSQDPVRIVMNFHNRHFTAILREEFQEALPEIPLVIDDRNLKSNDILLCDPEVLRDIVLQTRSLPEKIFLFNEKASSYSDFKAYNTINFFEPFFYYRIIRDILQKLYL